MEDQVYYWFVKNGSVMMKKNGNCIFFQLDYQNEESAVLTSSDNEQIIKILTTIAKQIWEDPKYERKPYINQLFEKINNEYFWQIDSSKLLISRNPIEKETAIKIYGSKELNLEVNNIVEIIQILEHLSR